VIARCLACVGIAVVVVGCKHDEPAEASTAAVAIPVVCEPVRSGALSDRIALRGVVGVPPDRDAVVASTIAGRVVDIRVHEGDRVKRGDVLATIDNPSLETAVQEVDAARLAAKAALANADTVLARARRLVDKGIAPRRDVEEAEGKQAAAAAELQAANARRELAVRQRARAQVTAPITGVVIQVHRHAGELVDGTAATPLVEIADPGELQLRADVPAADLVRIQQGASVEIHVDAAPSEVLSGKIVFVSPQVDPVTSLGVVRAAIDPASSKIQLKLGLAGVLTLALEIRASGLVVPEQAVRRSITGHEEVVVCETAATQTHAKVREVTVGARHGDEVEITSGLAAGDRVVTGHVLGLEDGAPIVPAAGGAKP
jgi:RND family efflux transporter MFP subunit